MIFEERFEETSMNDLSEMKIRNGRYENTMANLNNNSIPYIKHALQPNDTLQGLALQYGVSMEQIKRANKMWTADSLFLRSSLDIPVDKEALTVSSSPQPSPVSSPTHENGHTTNCNTSIDLSNHLSRSISDSNGIEESAADFLIRIDSHIAQTKDKVLRLQNKVVYSEDDLHNSRDGFSSRLSYQYQRTNSLNGSSSLSNLHVDPSLAPATAVIMTKGRKVRSSLKKLERQQDEIFEL